MVEPWQLKDERSMYRSKPFEIIERDFLTPRDNRRFTASVLKAPRWANVIATNDKKEILIIRQFRFGTLKIEWEIPGGVVEADETPLEAIKRELKEETGYITTKWVELGVVDQNPAIQTSQCFTFLAKNVQSVGEQSLEEFEDIDFEFLSIDDVQNLIIDKKMVNTYIVSAFYWYGQFLKSIENS